MKVFKNIYVSGTAVLLLTMTGCSAPKELQHPRVEQDALPTAFRLTHAELATDSLSNLAELPYHGKLISGVRSKSVMQWH